MYIGSKLKRKDQVTPDPCCHWLTISNTAGNIEYMVSMNEKCVEGKAKNTTRNCIFHVLASVNVHVAAK